ncbi:MAG TPA: AMP-binding protein [Acidimicrobiales bacterium]|nr:AMP-binding protein [Acidimicrobiales bacterium]
MANPDSVNLAVAVESHDPTRPALHVGQRTMSYGELVQRAATARSGLRAAGVEAGDRVAIVAPNGEAFPICLLAVWGLGAVAVPLNPLSPTPELSRELDFTAPRLALLGPSRQPVASLGEVPTFHLADLEAQGASPLPVGEEPPPPLEQDPDALAVLLFTAGTAGRPKAAMLTHGNLTWVQRALQDEGLGGVGADDVSLGVLPFFHVFGLNVSLCAVLRAGGSVVVEDHFDPVDAVADVERHGVTVIAGAPPMWRRWALAESLPSDALKGVRRATSGAAPLPLEVFEAVRDRFGVEVAEGYGLTETSPVVTTNMGAEIRPGSVGRPLPGVEVRLVDTDGEDALPGDPGEVWVRGPNVFAGYWQDEEATAAVLDPEGWFRTGDVAVEEDGYLYLVDRMKDLIIVSGFNVYPAEVEAVLAAHPAVGGAVVVGEDDPETGERIVAYVTGVAGNAPDSDQVAAWAHSELARYKWPSVIHVVDELPISDTGKAIRRRLR